MDIPVNYKVDRGVPIPVRKPVVPVNSLEVGESITFDLGDRANVQSLASNIKKRSGKDFTVKKINDSQCTIWRTK